MKEVFGLDRPPDVVPTCEKYAYSTSGKNYF